MKKLLTILMTGLTICFAINSFAQTVTIDYSYANLTDSCNVFATSKIYQGYSHRTSFGFPYFSQSDGAIILQSKPISSTNKGATQYAIRYNFKQGFTYQIKLYGKSTLGGTSSALPSAAINWSNDSAGVNSSFSCTGPVSRSSTFDINYGHMAFTTGWSWSPNLLNGVAPQNLTYLLVAAVPADGTYQNDQTISSTHIRKIEIVEIPPAGAFSISPVSPSMTCGSTTPITFTVNNNNNITGVTGYTWNFGATPNGWLLPNGSAAPATYSTGTTNTLALTPDCGKALSNVSATITANAVNYNTSNSSSVSISQPTYSINGVSSLCSGSTDYTLSSLVCNSALAWTAPPSNLGSLSSLTVSPTTLTYGGTSGNFTLTANVTSCGVATPVTLPVRVGPYTSSDYTMYGGNSTTQPLYWCPNQTYSFSVNGPGSNYIWTIPTGWTTNYNGGYVHVLKAPTSSYPPTGTVSVTFTEPCGNTITKSFFTAFSSSACIGTDPRFTYSPNPAPSYLNVAVASGYIGTVYIRRIQIISVNTGITVFDQTYGGNASSAYITTSGFQTGTYSLRIYDGSSWAAYQFLR